MNTKLMMAGMLAMIAGMFGLGTDYGFGAFFDIFITLFHQVLPILILLFVVGIFFMIFGAPQWIRNIFSMKNWK